MAASSGCLVVRHSRRCVFLLSLPVVRISPAAGFLLDGMLAVFYHPCARHGFELAGEVRRKEKKTARKKALLSSERCVGRVFFGRRPRLEQSSVLVGHRRDVERLPSHVCLVHTSQYSVSNFPPFFFSLVSLL